MKTWIYLLGKHRDHGLCHWLPVNERGSSYLLKRTAVNIRENRGFESLVHGGREGEGVTAKGTGFALGVMKTFWN